MCLWGTRPQGPHLLPVFELRKNKMVVPRTTRLQFVVVRPNCLYMAALEFHSLSVKINGCPSDNCIRFSILSGDLFGCPGRTENRNFERCFSVLDITRVSVSVRLCNNSPGQILTMFVQIHFRSLSASYDRNMHFVNFNFVYGQSKVHKISWIDSTNSSKSFDSGIWLSSDHTNSTDNSFQIRQVNTVHQKLYLLFLF